jgi:GntR family transcriptional regulator
MTSEQEIMDLLDVSRVTVRQAFDELDREGRILRVPGKGTFIAEPKKLEPQSALTSFSENMIALGMEPSRKTQSAEEVSASPEVAARLELTVGARVLHIDRLLLANGTPMAVMESYLPFWVYEKARSHFTIATLDRDSMYSLIEKTCGVTLWRARETVESAQAGEDAKRLDLDAGALTLSVHRLTTTQDGAPVEYTHLRYRGDLYRFQVELYRYGVVPVNPPRRSKQAGSEEEEQR